MSLASPPALFIPQAGIMPSVCVGQGQAEHLAKTQVSATLSGLKEGLLKLPAA